MPSTISSSEPVRHRQPLRERLTSFVLALLIEGLLVLLILWLSPVFTTKPGQEPTLIGFDVQNGDEAPAEASKGEPKPKRASGSREQAVTQPEPIVPPPPSAAPAEPSGPLSFVKMSRNDYARSDVANAPAQTSGGAGEGESSGSTAGDSQLAGGKSRSGEPLYKAEWYREPTDRELGAYIPERSRGKPGWGLIACRTVPNFRVEDCEELADAPRGSGLAGAVRQAAFQFRVRPPRIGGKPLVGSWVAIRIDYGVRGE